MHPISRLIRIYVMVHIVWKIKSINEYWTNHICIYIEESIRILIMFFSSNWYLMRKKPYVLLNMNKKKVLSIYLLICFLMYMSGQMRTALDYIIFSLLSNKDLMFVFFLSFFFFSFKFWNIKSKFEKKTGREKSHSGKIVFVRLYC